MIKSISELESTRKNILVLHYACTSFTKSPVIITSISVNDFKLGQIFAFSYAQYKNEKELLSAFLNFIQNYQNYIIVTWNQKSTTYGIQHIESRCYTHKLTKAFPIDYKNIVDLDDLLGLKYGKDYAPNPKLLNLAYMNKIPILNFVKGKKEIELFHNKEFKKIENSSNRKTAMLYEYLRLAVNDNLLVLPKQDRYFFMLKTSKIWKKGKPPTFFHHVKNDLKTLQTKNKFKPGLYYILLVDLFDSTKTSEMINPEENTKRIVEFIEFTKKSIPKQTENTGIFIKDIGDASLFLFNNFLDILNWKKNLEKYCIKYNKKCDKKQKPKIYKLFFKTIVHLGEIHVDDQGDPKSLALNQLAKIEKELKKNQFGITDKVRLVILPRVNSGQIKTLKIKEVVLDGEKTKSVIWNITKFTS